ncbi:MAG: shikimate dehydrogenase [Paludibacteraceae bacterium]|nr:shikimate dehydrogenase [Paludibacteraceae bacterium]
MRYFGIIGKPVAQSFSARYFTDKFIREGIDAQYERYELAQIEDIVPYLERLDGFNVTIPYKQAILPYLSGLDDTAREIGAVNVVNKAHIGYNTDCIGFMNSIRPLLCETNRYALILGTGGAAKAVHYGLKQLGLQTVYVSRTPNKDTGDTTIGYDALTEDIIRQHTVIVNCTPLGMWPKMDACAPIPYQYLSSAHLLYDCVYNPEQTLFLQQGAQQGARTCNGLGMLYGQAEAAWKIWNE